VVISYAQGQFYLVISPLPLSLPSMMSHYWQNGWNWAILDLLDWHEPKFSV